MQLSLSQALKHLTVICFGQGHYKSLGITQAQHAIGYTERKNKKNFKQSLRDISETFEQQNMLMMK